MLAKELVVYSETMATKVVTRSKLMIKSVLKRTMTSCESSHTMTGHGSRRDRQ
jgi:hypothetical protein